MFEHLIHRVEKWAEHHHAKKALSLVAFVESSFFPIPPFVLIIAMLSIDKKQSWIRLAIIGTISSVLGGIFGYFIGKFLYGVIGAPLVAFYGIQSEVAHLGQIFKDHVFATILLASISPLPYKVFTISAGLFGVDLWKFIIASIIGRGVRFFAVSFVADRYGARAKKFILEQQKVTARVILVLIIGVIAFYLLAKQGIL